jgi:multisubunit Na+/H+ antiporter MnhG subunit
MLALGGLASGLAMVWLFVRIVRFYALGEMPWLGLSKATVVATLMTLLYALGIYMLVFVVSIPAAIIVMISAAFAEATYGTSAGAGAAIFLFVAPAMLAIGVAMPWIACRLIVGLPPVALGKSPDFMKDMWQLSSGETWGLPLRLLAINLAALPIFGLAALAIMWPVFSELLTPAKGVPAGTFPLELFQTAIAQMLPGQAVFFALQLPLIWFATLVLTEANRRFLNRRSLISERP